MTRQSIENLDAEVVRLTADVARLSSYVSQTPGPHQGDAQMIGKGDNGETIVWLGEGDVLIITARQPGESRDNEIVFSQGDKPHPIGEASAEFIGKTTADMASAVAGGVDSGPRAAPPSAPTIGLADPAHQRAVAAEFGMAPPAILSPPPSAPTPDTLTPEAQKREDSLEALAAIGAGQPECECDDGDVRRCRWANGDKGEDGCWHNCQCPCHTENQDSAAPPATTKDGNK